MDVEIRSERTFIGVLSFEQTKLPRKWSLSDQRFASSLSNIISSAYLLEENKNLLLELLEKNQQLRDSTFTLSHNLREPLSQILGFAALHLQDNPKVDDVWRHLDKAAKQIDKVVRDLSNQLIKEQN
jgi:GAF domain-containing protein